MIALQGQKIAPGFERFTPEIVLSLKENILEKESEDKHSYLNISIGGHVKDVRRQGAHDQLHSDSEKRLVIICQYETITRENRAFLPDLVFFAA